MFEFAVACVSLLNYMILMFPLMFYTLETMVILFKAILNFEKNIYFLKKIVNLKDEV